MKTNELKKGMHVRLRNGWNGVIMDNGRGNTRMVEVDGYVKEIGSVYSHDIMYLCGVNFNGDPYPAIEIEHTDAQLKLKEQLDSLGL